MIILVDNDISKKETIDVGEQLTNYGKQMRELLSATKAEVRTYKFTVEKTDSGFDLDLAVKLSFNSRKNGHGTLDPSTTNDDI